jgi:hypothetical protein
MRKVVFPLHAGNLIILLLLLCVELLAFDSSLGEMAGRSALHWEFGNSPERRFAWDRGRSEAGCRLLRHSSRPERPGG